MHSGGCFKGKRVEEERDDYNGAAPLCTVLRAMRALIIAGRWMRLANASVAYLPRFLKLYSHLEHIPSAVPACL
jgi:hypothetical protein